MINLRTRFESFMSMLPSIEVIDDIELSKEKNQHEKADYLGLGRKIIFEQKALETDQIEKVQKKIDSFQNEEFFPLFYGKRDINEILKYFPDGEKIKLEIYTSITRQIEGVLSKANGQIPSTEEIFNLKDSIGILLLLNDSVSILTPEVIGKRISGRLGEKTKSGDYRFNRIQYVILISETHKYKDEIPLILIIEGPIIPKDNDGVNSYLDYLVYSWGEYNGGGVAHFNAENFNWSDFVESKENTEPKHITRSEARRAWYGQNRYLSNMSDEQVTRHGAKIIDTITPYVMKGGPQLPQNQLGELFFQFGDFIEEAKLRGLDLKEMKKYHK